ncbi:hypothetical protein CBL_21284, partial [Carabus blaptoides fortunei]
TGVLDISTSAIGGLAPSSDSESDVDNVAISSDARFQPKPKVVLPSQWNLHFTSEPKSISLGAFLERVDELRGKALVWYRANRSQLVNWDSLVERLREVFQPPDYDDRLFEEIKHRTQGLDETMDIYQLLGLMDIDSVESLLKLSRCLEHRRAAINAYVPPSRNHRALEPDLAYVGSSTQDTYSDVTLPLTSTTNFVSPAVDDDRYNQAAQTQSSPRSNNSSSPSTIQCWNCGNHGHRSAACRQPRNRHCYRCGKPQ